MKLMLDSRYRPCEGWREEAMGALAAAAHTGHVAVVGGCVAPEAGLSAAQWAMYLSEYAHAAPPLPAGLLDLPQARMLPAGNIAYSHEALDIAVPEWPSWRYHEALFRAGARFFRNPSMLVYYRPPAWREYAAERFRLSRRIAAAQPFSWMALASRAGLPALLLFRIARECLSRRRYGWALARSLPWLLAFALVQSAGEMFGLAVDGRRSCQH